MQHVKPFTLHTLAFLALFCIFTGNAFAVTDTYTTLNCAFSSPVHSITARATYYSSNSPTCGSMTLVATLPNATKVSYSPSSCSSGVHEFTVSAPVNGVYLLNASIAATTASCSTAALFFQQRPRLPETHPLIVVLVGLAAVVFARNSLERGKAARK